MIQLQSSRLYLFHDIPKDKLEYILKVLLNRTTDSASDSLQDLMFWQQN